MKKELDYSGVGSEGSSLDKNGYAPSILQWNAGEQCARCGLEDIHRLARHEVFHGPYRQKSKRLGIWITVCPTCHSYIHDRPKDRDVVDLSRQAQHQAMEKYGWSKEDFIREFGKNFL